VRDPSSVTEGLFLVCRHQHAASFPYISRHGEGIPGRHLPSRVACTDKKVTGRSTGRGHLRDAQTRLAPRCPSHHALHLSDKRTSISLASILPYRARGRCFQAGLFWMVLANLQGGTLRLVRVHGVRLVRRRSRWWGKRATREQRRRRRQCCGCMPLWPRRRLNVP